jgi:hypothetical protein
MQMTRRNRAAAQASRSNAQPGTREMTTPYANATTGTEARAEIVKMLQTFGCKSVGFMDDFAKHTVLLAFKRCGRQVQLRASARGWVAPYLK